MMKGVQQITLKSSPARPFQAQSCLGVCYLAYCYKHGIGIERDEKLANEWLEKVKEWSS